MCEKNSKNGLNTVLYQHIYTFIKQVDVFYSILNARHDWLRCICAELSHLVRLIIRCHNFTQTLTLTNKSFMTQDVCEPCHVIVYGLTHCLTKTIEPSLLFSKNRFWYRQSINKYKKQTIRKGVACSKSRQLLNKQCVASRNYRYMDIYNSLVA